MTDNPVTCRKCGSPVTPGMKFCESCGAKIEALTACPQCGAALAPGSKFCENCGMTLPLGAVPVKATPAPEPAPAKEVKSPAEPPTVTAPAAPAAVTAPVTPAAVPAAYQEPQPAHPPPPPQYVAPAPAPAAADPSSGGLVCKACGNPIKQGDKFCSKCLVKVTDRPAPAPAEEVKPPAEPPAVKIPAAAAAAAAPVTPAPLPAEEVKPPAEPPVVAAKAEEKPIPVPEKKPAPPPAQVKEPVRTEKVKEIPKETVAKKPIASKTMIIAGIIILALLGAGVYFVGLPMITGPVTPSQNQQTPTVTIIPVTTIPVIYSPTPVITADTSQDTTVSLTPGPTQVPPSNRVIVVDTERDPISSIITVTFRGGEGQYGVSQIVVRLTRSDGTAETKTFKPDKVGSGVTLQGTARTDRIEVTSNFYTGEQYKIIDQIFEYKKRGG